MKVAKRNVQNLLLLLLSNVIANSTMYKRLSFNVIGIIAFILSAINGIFLHLLFIIVNTATHSKRHYLLSIILINFIIIIIIISNTLTTAATINS